MIAFLSGAGVFYVTQVHEKSARAYLKSPTFSGKRAINQADFVDMNKKRLCTNQAENAPIQKNEDMPE